MTATELARQEGFQASLSVRGVPVTLKGSDAGPLLVLIERGAAPSGRFETDETVGNRDRIHTLRADIPAGMRVGVGSVFVAGDGAHFRVESVEDSPSSLTVVWTVASYQPTA